MNIIVIESTTTWYDLVNKITLRGGEGNRGALSCVNPR